MTVVTCGRTSLSERAEAMTRVLREQQGFCLDVGCGQTFDLDNELQHIRVYRCLECARWLCKPCIVAHFEETNDAYRPARERAPIAPAQEITHEEVPHQTSGHDQERGASACAAGVPRTLSEGHPMRAFGVVTGATGEQEWRPASPTTATSTRAVDMRNGQSG